MTKIRCHHVPGHGFGKILGLSWRESIFAQAQWPGLKIRAISLAACCHVQGIWCIQGQPEGWNFYAFDPSFLTLSPPFILMEKQFQNKVALVTGGSFGIGRATAVLFARHGARVAVVDWQQDEETLKQIHTVGGEAIFIRCDVSKDSDVRAMVEQVIARFGRLDFAFNNAGIEGETAPTHEVTEENWNRVIDINLKGAWLCMKYELPHMLQQGKGVIVNCSSIAGLVGFPGIAAYAASKHGLLGLTKTAALEYAQSGVRINAICPGVIKTPMIDRFIEKNNTTEEAMASGEPIGRMGTPEEVAEGAVWLCSDAASFITGHPLVADGGWVAR
jgi:NAD(P)-dependent dehydrogenase (short-subunit alcohol dehydrogenase family)